ncbi:MAG: glycosyltransferase [Thermoplasmata archaeon]|nr:glycosyltransferase [Thermoplasmata archaeon]
MRIGMFTLTYPPTPDGVAYYVWEVKRALEALGHEVVVFTNTLSASQPSSDEGDMVRFRSLPFPPYPNYRVPFFPFKKGVRIARRKDLDIVHVHTPFMYGTMGYFVHRELGLPLVSTFHTNFTEMRGTVGGRFLNSFMIDLGWFYSLMLYRKSDAVLAPTEKMATLLRSEGVGDHVHVVWDGIDPRPYGSKADVDLSRFGIPADRPLVLFLSRVTRDKGVYTLLDCAERVHREAGAVFVVAGTGPEREALAREVSRRGVGDFFRVVGFVSDEEKIGLYQRADVFVLPSKAETFGMVLLEAMAAGTPVVAAASGGILDVVRDGENGLLFPFGDSGSLADTLLRVLGDSGLRDGLIEGGRRFVNEEASIRKSAERTLEIYESLL